MSVRQMMMMMMMVMMVMLVVYCISWRRPTFIQVTRVNFCNAFAIDDSTINFLLPYLSIIAVIVALVMAVCSSRCRMRQLRAQDLHQQFGFASVWVVWREQKLCRKNDSLSGKHTATQVRRFDFV